MADGERAAGYRPPSRIGMKATTFYLDPELLRRLKNYALLVKVPMWQLVAHAIVRFLDANGAPPAPPVLSPPTGPKPDPTATD